MTNIEEVIERCSEVVSKWRELNPTIELAQDFASVFGFQLNWTLTPTTEISPVAPTETVETVETTPQYELFNEMSEEDQYAMKSWRENNGLAWR